MTSAAVHAPPRISSGAKAAGLALLLFSITFAIFSPTLRYGLVDLDDITYVSNNTTVLEGLSASSIRQANAGQYDFYLALHSNASGPGAGGRSRGILAFYYPTSANGRRAAELFVENLRDIYPLPEKVSTRATTSLGEVRQPRFPSVLLELGYHDNPDDALWIQENIPRIAANLVLSLTEYFGLPYTAPTPQPGQVSTVSGGPVNLRSAPSLQSPVTARLPDGDGVTVYGRYQDWYVVSHGEHLGYVSAPFIRLS